MLLATCQARSLVGSSALTATAVYVRFPVISSAVKLMVELCLFTGLGKRKRVMDEKELMIPLELGYVQEAERKKALIKRFTSECVEMFLPFMITSMHGRKCTKRNVSLNKYAIFSFLMTQVAERDKNQTSGGEAAG